jgi:CelD/BcsL family acetyltransferase involved in cellulose biosynthesis
MESGQAQHRAGSAREPGEALSLSESEEISPLAPEWDALCRRLKVSPFLRPGWFSAWWEPFGSGRLELLVARRGDQLVGVLPLMRTRASLSSPVNWHSPEFAPVAEDEGVERALLDHAMSRARGRLDLGFLPDRSVTQRIASVAMQSGQRVVTRTVEQSPYVEIDGDWEAFEGRLPSKRRTELRRRKRRLEELGSYEFQCLDGSERLAELLEEGFEVEAAGWVGRDGTPIAAKEATRVFYERVAHWAAGEGQLRLWFLRLDGKAIAFAFCLADSESLYVLKIGFDPSHSRFAPGLLLSREMLANAFETGLSTYEFLGADEPYKLIWTEQCRDRGRVQAFPRTATGLAHYLAWRHGRPIIQKALRR